MNLSELIEDVPRILENIQKTLFQRALDFRDEHTKIIDYKDEFYKFFTPSDKNKAEIHGGFAWVHWDRDSKWEEQIKNELKVTIRCIPENSKEAGVCLFSGNPSPGRVVMAKAY